MFDVCMVSNIVVVDVIIFSIFISYWWKIFGNRYIRGEFRVCYMYVYIIRCIYFYYKFIKNWCIINILLFVN